MKKKKKTPMHPSKTLDMKFNSPVAPVAMCGESFVSFTEWMSRRKDKDKKKKRH